MPVCSLGSHEESRKGGRENMTGCAMILELVQKEEDGVMDTEAGGVKGKDKVVTDWDRGSHVLKYTVE